MEGEDKGLVKKLGWAYNFHSVFPKGLLTIEQYQKLEDEGYGMLADKNDPDKVDESDSVVCPDGTIVNSKDIDEYIKGRKANYSSENKEDIKMFNVQMYCLGFKH